MIWTLGRNPTHSRALSQVSEHNSKTPIYFDIPEGVGFHPGVRTFLGKSPETPIHFIQPEGVHLCPRSWDILGTEFQDPNSFQCPRGCGVLLGSRSNFEIQVEWHHIFKEFHMRFLFHLSLVSHHPTDVGSIHPLPP